MAKYVDIALWTMIFIFFVVLSVVPRY